MLQDFFPSQIDLGLNLKEFQILFVRAQIHLKHLNLLKFVYSPSIRQKGSFYIKTKQFMVSLYNISTMNTYHDNSNMLN